MPGPVKILVVIAAIVATAVAFTFVGYRLGDSRLSTGVSAVDMAKVGARTSMSRAYRGARVDPIWLPDGDRFVYNASDKGAPRFMLVDPTTGEEESLSFPPEIRAQAEALAVVGDEGGEAAPFPPKRFSYVDEETVEFVYGGRLLRYQLEAQELTPVVELGAGGPDPLVPQVATRSFPMVWPNQREQLSPDRAYVLSLDDDDLHLRNASGARTSIAPRGEEFFDWGLNDAKWSPDDRYVMVPYVDSRGVAKAPVVDWLDMTAPVRRYPYPTLVGESMKFGAVLFDVETGAARDVEFEPETYVTALTWRPDSSELLISSLSRDARTIKVLAVDPDTGRVRTIMTEESDTYIIYPPNFIFRGGPDFHLSRDGTSFLWVSEKTGFRQLYLHSLEDGAGRALTDHPFDVASIGGFSQDGERVLYTALSNPERPYDIHVHAVEIAGGESVRLSEADGQHAIELSPSGRYFVDKYSTTAHPPIVELRSFGGDLVKTLSVGKRPPGAALIAPVPEHFSALAADGETTIHGVIYKPSDFDPSKTYPVIDSIYGGGFVNNVPHRFDSPNPFFGRNFPEFGFIVVAVDARGTPGRGKAFKDMARREFGQFEIADHVAAIKAAAAERPWMDIDRVGIVGHSYGGYFTIRGLLQAPDFYKVGVASGVPEMDKDMSSIATEAFSGLLEGTEEELAAISNAAIVDRLEGKLMLVVQTSDVNTPAHGAIKMVNALTDANKPYDLLLLPGANHAFRGSNHRRYFYERVGAYFQEHLAGGAEE